jgi:polyisoprenoid-binding protein YceI
MSVALRVEATELRVVDRDVSASDRAKIQATMEGPEVLDAARFSEIAFTSTAVTPQGGDRWTVQGNLTLHGQIHPLSVDVALAAGHYRGSLTLSQRAFGIAPISIGGGTVKVKDELKIDFDIVLAA